MKKNQRLLHLRIVLLFLGVLISIHSYGSVASYTFSQNAGSYTTITGGTVLGDTNTNNANFTGLNIGFTFYYNGQAYTQFGVNANGYIILGTQGMSSNTVISSNQNTNVIAGLNFDIQSQATGEIQYRTTGAAPNQILTVQWKSFRAAGTTGDNLNFQIRLREGSNNVEVKYGTCFITVSRTAQIGLKGNSNADYNNRFVADTVNTWLTSDTGSANNSNCMITPAFGPSSGLTYTWAPPTPPAVPITMTFSNITPTRQTVEWLDNSTTETSFLVYQSSDNVTFTLVSTVASTTTGATGGMYSYNSLGLNSATTYYYRVYAMENTPSTTFLSGNSATLAGTVCGTFNVGPTGDFINLKSAIADLIANGLSCSVIIELQPAYLSSADTFPIVIPGLGTTALKTLTIRPEAGAVNLKLGSDSLRTIDLNGASYVTIDGRAGGAGTTRNLSVIDSLGAGNAIRFVNDAHHNTLNYLIIQGATTGGTTNGVIQFSNGATTAGNSNNTISNCEITKSDSFPQVMLYSNTNTGNNSSNTITNNLFHDWLSNTSANYAINLGANNESWTITNNSFYQTAPQTYSTSASTHAAINISGGGGGGSSGSGFVITGNFIGGSAPSCGGSAWTINGTASPRFNGIALNADNESYSSIQGNTIRNFSITTAATAGGAGGSTIFNGITISGGNVNVGNTTANTIGSTSAANSITTTASGNGVQVVGINTSSGDTVVIQGNSIGGINANDSAGVNATSVLGIVASAGNVAIRNNTIGSNTIANSIVNASTTATGAASQVTGISSSNTDTCTISGNLIKNLSNLYRGTTTASYVRGISTSGGSNLVSANTIEFLSNTSSQAGTNGNSSVIGISQTSQNGNNTITGNVVRSLSNKSDSGNVVVTGIYNNGPATGNNSIHKNRIYGLSAPADTSVATINGVHLNGGNSSVYNNMISIGTDTTGGAYTKAHVYNGILKTSNTGNDIVFNTVRVGGTSVVNRSVNSFAFRRTAAGTDTLRNNVLSNFRSNAAAGGKHYSIGWSSATNMTSGKNILFGNGTGFVLGLLDTVDQNNLFSWFSTTGQDSNSISVNPNFISTINLHINNATPSPLESKGYTIPGITTDFDNHVRPGPAGSSNGGATAPDIGADEFDGTPVNLDMGAFSLAKPTSGCHTSTDSVVVAIKNYSSQTINFATNNVAVHVSATGLNPFTFPVVNVTSGTLASGATRNVVVSTTYNMSALGTYVFDAYTVTAGDPLTFNDTLSDATVAYTNGTTSPTLSSICAGIPLTLTVAGQSAGSAIQWQSSPNNSTWSNIVGATSTTVNVTPSATTYYRAKVCGTFDTNVDTVNVSSVASPTTSGASRCGVGNATVSATSANTVLWYDSLTGGSLLDTGSTYTAFVGATRSFYAASRGNLSAQKNLATLISGPNNSGGIMFTVTALGNVTVTGFDCQADSGVNTWGIWYRPDDFTTVPGANTNSNGWIFVDSVTNVTSAGPGAATTIPINMAVLVPSGKTYSFYVNVTSGPNVIYSVGTGAGNVNASNTDLQVRDGFAGTLFNCTTSPRVFNGAVRYKTSCISNRVAATVTVTNAPTVNVNSNPNAVCSGDSVTLSATSANSNYRYSWVPNIALSDSIGSPVQAAPAVTTTYSVVANDSTTNCGAIATVTVNVTPAPPINITVNNDSLCSGDSLFLNANVPTNYNFGASLNSNNATTYPAPYGNDNFGARHQMLVRAEEMQAAGMARGYINSLSFTVNNLNAVGNLVNFTIKIGNSVKTELVDTFQTSPLTTVYTNASYVPVTGVNTHNFSTPFYWNGSANILIETCFNNATSTANAGTRRSTTAFPSCTFYAADSANNCTKTIGTAGTLRPNMRFGIRNQYIVHWISNQTLSDTTSSTTFTVPTQTDNYYVTVNDTISGCSRTDSISVVVEPSPVVNLGPDTTICGFIELDAGNPGDVYMWSDSSTAQTLYVSTPGIYSVLVTQFGSCSATDTVEVLSVIPLIPVTLVLGFDSMCTTGGIRTLSGGTPFGGTFSGPGVSGTNFDPMVAGAGIHAIGYTVIDTATGCPSTGYDNVEVFICTGIRVISSNGLINVYPNPVHHELTVDLQSIDTDCVLQIVTPESKIVYYNTLPGGITYPINVDNLAAGVYFLKVKTGDSNNVIRFIKQ
jgi:hypothetical protein